MLQKVNDYFTDWQSGTDSNPMGLISNLGATGKVPWTAGIGRLVDYTYHTMHGRKVASAFLSEIYSPDLTAPVRLYVAQHLAAMFSEDWQRLWDALQLPYTATHNYDITETKNEDHTFEIEGSGSNTQKTDETHSQTTNGSDTHSGTDTVTREGTDTTEGTGSVNRTDSEVQSGTDSIDYGASQHKTTVTDTPGIKKTITEDTTETPNVTVKTTPGIKETTTTTRPTRTNDIQESYPLTGLMVSTVDSGKEINSEKGGSQTYTWGFDSESPIPQAMHLARGGQGSGGGGDGTAEGDGHVTTTEYVNRTNVSTTTGSKSTVETETFATPEIEIHEFEGSDSELTSGNTQTVRSTEESYEGSDSTVTDVTDYEHTDTTTFGKKVDHTITDGSTSKSETSVNRTDTYQHGEKINRESDLSGTDSRNITGSDTSKDSGSENTQHQLTRQGNIGGITTQTLLSQEYELRTRHFFNQVFRDIDSVLTIPIFA